MSWGSIRDNLLPHIVRIETQAGSGTGFLVGYNPEGTLAAIATAAHVIRHAHEWQQPIKLTHHKTESSVFLAHNDRAVLIDYKRDAATILIHNGALELPDTAFQLLDCTKYRRVGYELGWMGFPSVAAPNLCFFKGTVSAFLMDEDCYLIDGVAINGVSGGPVFSELKDGLPEIVGIISAYLPNMSGNTPGLLRAQDITPFDLALKTLKSMYEAKEKEKQRTEEKVEGVLPEKSDEGNAGED